MTNIPGPLSEISEDVHFIGVGGIGSVMLLPFVRMCAKRIHLWDPDVVEKHNLGYQHIYREEDLGRPKVEAAADYLRRQDPDVNLVLHQARVTHMHGHTLSGIVISGVDTMAARKQIWESVWYNGNVLFYVDGRTGGPQLDCFLINPCESDQVDFYQGFLFPDKQAAQLPCGSRDDSDSAGILGRLITRQVTLFARLHKDEDSKTLPAVRIMMHVDSLQIEVTTLADIKQD